MELIIQMENNKATQKQHSGSGNVPIRIQRTENIQWNAWKNAEKYFRTGGSYSHFLEAQLNWLSLIFQISKTPLFFLPTLFTIKEEMKASILVVWTSDQC